MTQMSIIKFTNGFLASDGVENQADLFVDESSGLIIAPHEVPEGAQVQTIDLRSRILSPGLIDVQLNGCCGINFSETSIDSKDSTRKVYEALAGLIKTGVTSFLPTLTTSKKEASRQVGTGCYESLMFLSHFTGPPPLQILELYQTNYILIRFIIGTPIVRPQWPQKKPSGG